LRIFIKALPRHSPYFIDRSLGYLTNLFHLHVFYNVEFEKKIMISKEEVVFFSMVLSQHCPESLGKKTKNLRVVANPSEIQFGYLLYTSVERYFYTNIFGDSVSECLKKTGKYL